MRKVSAFLLIVLWLAGSLPPLCAQKKTLAFDHLSTEHGLSNLNGTSLAQDSLGYVWIGTENGLNRFGGQQVDVYKNRIGDSTSLINNSIEKVYTDRQSRLWIVTAQGVSRYIFDQDCFSNYVPTRPATSVFYFDITEDADGRILLLAKENLVFVYNEEEDTFDFLYQIPLADQVDPFVVHRHTLYAGYQRGILEVDLHSGRVLARHSLPGLREAPYNKLSMRVIHGSLWVVGYGIGVYQMKLNTQEITHHSELSVTTVAPYDEYTLLLGGTGGLYTLNLPDTTIYPVHAVQTEGYLVNSTEVLVDRGGTVWVASKGNGIMYGSDNRTFFDAHSLNDSLSVALDRIHHVQYVGDNLLWITLYSGITYVVNTDRGTFWRAKTSTDHLRPYPFHGTAFQVMRDRAGQVWVGTHREGAKLLDADGRQLRSTFRRAGPEEPGKNDVRSIVQDHQGYIWLAVHGYGLEKIHPTTHQVVAAYHADTPGMNSSITPWITTLLCTRRGAVWGGASSGLQLIDGSVKRTFQYDPHQPNSLSSDQVNCLLIDRGQNVWIGTEKGLNLFDPSDSSFIHFTMKDGLNDNYISSLVEDSHGALWIGTGDGLAKMTFRSPEDVDIEPIKITRGDYSSQFIERAATIDSAGNLYFGTTQGLLYFNVDQLPQQETAPSVHFTDFKLFNESVPIGAPDSLSVSKTFFLPKHINYLDTITLAHTQNAITLSFAAVHFARPENVHYRYQLSGYDEYWIAPETGRAAIYSMLPPGDYTFRVQASGSRAFIPYQERTIQVHIRYPWYRTYPGLALLFGLAAGLLLVVAYVIVERVKLKNEHERERELNEMKTRFFMNVSHELKTPLTLIQGPTSRLADMITDPQAQEHIQLISNNTQRLTRLVNQLLALRKLETSTYPLWVESDDLVAFVHEAYASFQHVAQRHAIEYQWISDREAIPEAWFDKDALDKILYNLLSNAFKFTPDEGRITVALTVTDTTATVRVEDTGVGIPPDQQSRVFDRFYQIDHQSLRKKSGTGIGLALTQELAVLHKGGVSVRSEPGQGSEFSFSFPIDRASYAANEKKPVDAHPIVATTRSAVDDTAVTSSAYQDLKAQSLADKVSHPVLNVLIVDDNAELRYFIRDTLSDQFNIVEAEDGESALDKAITLLPDMIVADVMMPRMDGLELCQRIKSDPRTDHIPVILLTARSDDHDQMAGLAVGADDYLIKPFKPEILLAKIRTTVFNRHKLWNKLSDQELTPSLPSTSPEKEFIQRLLEAVRQHLAAPLDAQLLAKELGMSKSQLYRKVKSLTGKTVLELVREYKLEKAAKLLAEGDHTVAEIAELVGFSDPTNFSRSFKQYAGVTPREYRRRPLSSLPHR